MALEAARISVAGENISFFDDSFGIEGIPWEVLAVGVSSIGVYESDCDSKEELACIEGGEVEVVSCSKAVVLAVEKRISSVCVRSVGIRLMLVFIAELVIQPTVSGRN